MKITVTIKLGALQTMVHYHSADHFVISMRDQQASPVMDNHLKRVLADYFSVEPEAVHLGFGRSLIRVVEVEGGELPEDRYQHRFH